LAPGTDRNATCQKSHRDSGTWQPGVGFYVHNPRPAPELELPESITPVPAQAVAEPIEPVPELTPGQKAEAFLRDALVPDVRPALEVQRLAGEAGIKARTLRRTRERMKVRCFKRAGHWWWEIPEMTGQ
jgi:hypothetical protein